VRLAIVVLSCVLALPAVAAADALADARRLIARGKYADAERMLTPLAASAPAGDAALELGLLKQTLGRRDDARPLLTAVADAGRSASDAVTLARAGRAARALGSVHVRDSHAFYRDAVTLAPNDPQINTAWGELFLQTYNLPDAIRSFKTALTADPKFAPAHVGLARALVDDDTGAAAEAAKRALAIDPEAIGAHLVLADIAMDETRRDEARAAAQKALDVNPASLEARSILAAVAYLEGRRPDYEAEIARILAVNPAFGEGFRIVGDYAARNYRFDEAVALARRAIMLDLENARAHADLGLHLMRVGDERGARAALERAFRSDPFDIVTYNLLALLDTLDKFETIEAGELIVRFHPDETPVMREYVIPLAQEALKTLSARYGFKPQAPILIEMFPVHDDFAVRNLGLPGLIGALGACFGRVVTLDSPRARPPGTFNWGATLWHEMAHVITLQMSRQRVPRWLTEGISVFEEGRARPEWGREMQLTFVDALERGKVMKLRDLNAGFTRADTIALAYYQASLLVEQIVEAHGEPALHRLLRAYGQGLEGDAAMQSAIGLTMDGLQPAFDAAIEKKFGALRRALAETNPENYRALVAKGRALHRAGNADEAIKVLERAAELVPVAAGEDSPRALLAAIAEERGDTARAMRELELLLTYDHTALAEARKLVTLAEQAKDLARLRLAYERVVAIDPFDSGAHGGLGRLALAQGRTDLATREFRAALASKPVDLAAAHTDLAEALLAAGEAGAAKRQVMAALEIAPRYERAQELLLKAAEVRP